MATYSITVMNHETRVYLNPPFSKPIQYIEVIECHAPSEWFTLNEIGEVAVPVKENSNYLLTLTSGEYSLESLQWMFEYVKHQSHVSIMNDGTRFYLFSHKYDKVLLSKELADCLGVPEMLMKHKAYTIHRPIKKVVKVYCDLIEEHSLYENDVPKVREMKRSSALKEGSINITPSQLLAVVPSQNYPRLQVSKTKNPINYFTVKIFDENGNKINLINEPIRIQLKLSF